MTIDKTMKQGYYNRALVLFVIQISLYSTVVGQIGERRPIFEHERILNCLARIDQVDSAGTAQPWAAGVFVDIDSTDPNIYLITNQHVVVNRDQIVLGLYVFEGTDSVRTFRQQSTDPFSWRNGIYYCPESSNTDFIAIGITRRSVEGIISPIKIDEIVEFNELKYADPLLFYGYPLYEYLGFSQTSRKLPIVRAGILSYFLFERVEESRRTVASGVPGEFLIDGMSVPGNSGGPIFINRPYQDQKRGTSYDRRLAGIVFGHVERPKTGAGSIEIADSLVAVIDSLESEGDSTSVREVKAKLSLLYHENLDLVRAISISTIVNFIKSKKL